MEVSLSVGVVCDGGFDSDGVWTVHLSIGQEVVVVAPCGAYDVVCDSKDPFYLDGKCVGRQNCQDKINVGK